MVKQLEKILDRKNALYAQFTDKDYVELYLKPHLNGKHNNAQRILSAVTMEIWFQQIFNKKFLTKIELK
jgi:hypothetical protein